MKRTIVYLALIASAVLFARQGREIAQLVPVEVLMVVQKEEIVVLKTDTGNEGEGKSLTEAKEDLEEKTPGILFLDTVEYLVMTEEDQVLAEQLCSILKPSVKLAFVDADADPAGLARYLDAHWDGGNPEG